MNCITKIKIIYTLDDFIFLKTPKNIKHGNLFIMIINTVYKVKHIELKYVTRFWIDINLKWSTLILIFIIYDY